MPKFKNFQKHQLLDLGILIPYLILSVIGLIMVYSSTSYGQIEVGANAAGRVIVQVAFWLLSLFLISVIFKMKTSFLKNKQLLVFVFIVVFVLLGAALLFGKEVNGAKGWLYFGPVSLQPAEYLKILVVWYLAVALSERQLTVTRLSLKDFIKDMKIPLGTTFIMIAIVALFPDMGNAAVISLLALIMLLASGIYWGYAVFVGGAGILGSMLIIQMMIMFGDKILPKRFLYIYDRFASFRNPFAYELDQGHQLANGYYAMFNGGLLGRGLGNSIQKKGFLREAHTDFIFAITIEELGFIGALLILLLLFFLILRIFLIGIRAKKPFNSLICIGMASLFLLQVFINLGGITGLIPLTGITFPFLSQGGNSLLVLSVAVGFALNISADEKRMKLEGIKQ